MALCPQPCEHLSQQDAQEAVACEQHPCICSPKVASFSG